MSVTTVTISSLADLLAKVTPPDPDPAIGRHRDSGVYRGGANAAWPLLTSLDTLGGVSPAHSKADLESHILRNFIRYSRPFFGHQVSDWEVLIAAQHHGAPTRLLDWTYSPMVAAHFATLGAHSGEDRAVWRLDWKAVHRFFQLPERALLIQDLEEVFGKDRPFTPWALFEPRTRERQFACMIEPPSLDARIATQAATFTLCSDNRQPFDSFLEGIGLRSALTRFVIPAADARRLRDQLDMVSVDERRLFPDLDGLSAYLRRYYS
jgi:FRG domain